MKKIFPHELIGQEIIVVSSTNKNQVGKTGKIIDETCHTIVVQLEGKQKTLLKNTIQFKLKETGEVINGKNINKRSEDRLKGR